MVSLRREEKRKESRVYYLPSSVAFLFYKNYFLDSSYSTERL